MELPYILDTDPYKVNRFVYTLIVGYESNCDRAVELLLQYLQSIFVEHSIDDVHLDMKIVEIQRVRPYFFRKKNNNNTIQFWSATLYFIAKFELKMINFEFCRSISNKINQLSNTYML